MQVNWWARGLTHPVCGCRLQAASPRLLYLPVEKVVVLPLPAIGSEPQNQQRCSLGGIQPVESPARLAEQGEVDMRASEQLQEGDKTLRHSDSAHSLGGAAKPVGAEYHVQGAKHERELVPQLQSNTWS